MKKREDHDFLKWVETLPSIIDESYSEILENGERRNVACHVRRSGKRGVGAGTGYKPLYSAVPMTFKQHQLQSSQGELAVIMTMRNWKIVLEQYEGANFVMKSKSFFDKHALRLRTAWEKMKGKPYA